MSDNVSDEEQQQQMEEISICADIWLEVFAFLDPVELGLKLALISDRFDALVDVHFKSRKWLLAWLYIDRATDGNGAEIVVKRGAELSSINEGFVAVEFSEPLPIPQGPLPTTVIGFEVLGISYVDQSVIEFLQRIRRLFDSSGTTVAILTSEDQSRSWEIIWQKIWPFVNDNIGCFRLTRPLLDHLRQFSPAILRNCANLRSIEVAGLFPEFPAEDNAGASSTQAVAKWLLTPRQDGLPKMIRCFYPTEIEGLKGAFVNASEPVNFIIHVHSDGLEPFELKNNLTGERLALRQMNEAVLLLVRCPIEREEAKWAKWEKEAIELNWFFRWNRIDINFNDRDIGDGMVGANDEGPSEPKK